MSDAAAMSMAWPVLIQGGMGIGVSGWPLARAVSRRGQLGVVSGTGVDSLFVRRLQDGDLGGHLRRAMERFPMPEVAAAALREWFVAGGRTPAAAVAAPISASGARTVRWPGRLPSAIVAAGVTFRAPHIQIGRHRVWGATCMILAEVMALMSRCPVFVSAGCTGLGGA